MSGVNVDRIVLMIAERIREKSTKKNRIPFVSGDLRKSIQVEHIGEGKATVGSNLIYARAVHDGRPAMTIKPNVAKNPPRGNRTHKNKKKARLRFTIGGKIIFAKSVKLPAMRGQPFLRKAVNEMSMEGYQFLLPVLKREVSEEVAEKIVKNIKFNINF